MGARLALASRLAMQDPLLLADYARWYIGDRVGIGRQRLVRQGNDALRERLVADSDGVEARRFIAELVGGWSDGSALRRVRDYAPAAVLDAARVARLALAGDPSLGEVCYGLVRALRPSMVVETGVAMGVTSAYVLAALADNDFGELHSIDLSPTCLVLNERVGAAIPPELRNRWRLHPGSSRRLLPRVLRQAAGSMGIFIHDSDHRYGPMRWELEQAWAALASGGWLVADDVDFHTAFQDVAATIGVEPLYVVQPAKQGCTGLLHKPATG